MLPIGVIFGFALSVQAWSDQNTEDLFSITLGELSQIVITGATMHDESLSSVPASVTVYTREEIRNLGVTKLTQLMNFVPGFQSQRNDQSSFSDAYSARGIRFDSSGREILILLDGQRLNADWSGGVNITSGIVDLYLADRVEFIRGPSSPLYGSNAFIGIINITTKAINEVDFALGTDNFYHGGLQVNHKFDRGSIELFMKKLDDSGQDLTVYDSLTAQTISTKDPYGLENIHFKAKYGKTTFMFHYNETYSEEFYMLGRTSNEENYLESSAQFASLAHVFSLPNSWNLKASLSMSSHRFDLKTVVLPAPTEILIEGEIEEQEPKLEAVFTQSLASGEKNVVGFEWRRPKITDSDAYISGAFDDYSPQAPLDHRTISGVFLQHQNYISENLHYVLGLRFDDYSNFGNNTAPRLGLVWVYNQSNIFKMLYGESFRAPSRSETDIMNSSAYIANPDLKPEVAKTSELIWLYQQPDYNLSSTLFYTELTDVIINLPVTPIERINGGNEYVSGLELELKNSYSKSISSRINASWIMDGLQEINSDAEVFIGGMLMYQQGNLQTSLMLDYHSSKQDADISTDGFRHVSPRTYLGLNLRYKTKVNAEWYMNISNVLNEEYDSVATYRAENIEGVENRGIAVLSGIRMAF